MKPIGSHIATNRILELDGLRGLAALAVLVWHLPLGFWFGETGVDLFFVLSGFLITGIILRAADQPGFLRTFYWRRCIRIFPIYYLVLFTAYGLNSLRSHPEDVSGFPYYIFYLQHIHEYWGGTTPPTRIALSHTWTLAIEEQFYLFWPVIFVFLKRRTVVLLTIGLLVTPVILRYWGLPRTVLLGHTDGLAWGAILAWAIPGTKLISQPAKASVFAAIAGLGMIGYAWLCWWGPTRLDTVEGPNPITQNSAIAVISCAYFGVVGLVVVMTGSPILSGLRCRPLVYVGKVSYGLYLYHFVVYKLLDTIVILRWQMNDPWWLDSLKLIASFVAAIVSWHWIEQPILRWKDRFVYDRRATFKMRGNLAVTRS